MAYKRVARVKRKFSKRSKVVNAARLTRLAPRLRRSAFTSGTVVGRTLGFPRMFKFKHLYNELVSGTDSGSKFAYQFTCNGMYDCNITGTGAQPLYFDQLSAIYDHYVVIGSKITYRVVPSGISVQYPYKCVCWVNDDTSVAPPVGDESSIKGAKTRVCTGGINPSQIIMSQRWSAKRYFGGSTLANTELQGTSASNPTEQSYYQFTMRTLDGVSTVSIYLQVSIEYIAVWKELKDIAQS